MDSERLPSLLFQHMIFPLVQRFRLTNLVPQANEPLLGFLFARQDLLHLDNGLIDLYQMLKSVLEHIHAEQIPLEPIIQLPHQELYSDSNHLLLPLLLQSHSMDVPLQLRVLLYRLVHLASIERYALMLVQDILHLVQILVVRLLQSVQLDLTKSTFRQLVVGFSIQSYLIPYFLFHGLEFPTIHRFHRFVLFPR